MHLQNAPERRGNDGISGRRLVSENVSMKQVKTRCGSREAAFREPLAVSMKKSRPTILSQTVGRGVHDRSLQTDI